jgi:hypothetical protein
MASLGWKGLIVQTGAGAHPMATLVSSPGWGREDDH